MSTPFQDRVATSAFIPHISPNEDLMKPQAKPFIVEIKSSRRLAKSRMKQQAQQVSFEQLIAAVEDDLGRPHSEAEAMRDETPLSRPASH